MKQRLETIAEQDGRYSPAALGFVYEGLTYATKEFCAEPGHITGQQLCEGLGHLAVEKWGRLAMLVLNSWGVKTTDDFGEIVYLMIDHKWMSCQPEDSIEDFHNVYDFKTLLRDDYDFSPSS